MLKKILPFSIIIMLLIFSCGKNENQTVVIKKKMDMEKSNISKETVAKVVSELQKKFPKADKGQIDKGVSQVAALWFQTDGSFEEFEAFCNENFIGDESAREQAFNRINTHFETLFGYNNKITINLMLPLHISGPEPTAIDMMFGSYNPASHFAEDMFNNKIAFYTMLNFPAYSLKEKTDNTSKWSRLDWGYARLGDVFSSRVPGTLSAKYNEIVTKADTYISEYNIFMGKLVNAQNKTLFPTDMKLISHWGLRDELKSNYAGNQLEKQQMIYAVMKNIISQEIPQEVINSDKYEWNPISNKVYEQGKEIKFKSEPDVRYQHLLDIFNGLKEMDAYNPTYPNYISRKFDAEMEMSQPDVEAIFTQFITSPQVKQVAELISKRLGRNLEPFDIWYDGFKSRSSLNEDDLSKKTLAKYPTTEAYQKDLPVFLTKLGWSKERAEDICSHITVDASRGAGHAWGSEMRGDNARLRSRISEKGMDYKGYNIGMHEFGHNVEQTISLYDIDHYILHGVPNTAFTEALAFAFQKRDLEMLGIKETNTDAEHLQALDNFWGCYEIMGVSLVDMKVWQWLYENPNATASQLKEKVIATAKEVWNQYYAPIFGKKDEPILAIYSHMIDAPLYLSAYPIGHLIEFQLDLHLKGKPFNSEIDRIYKQGRLTPHFWMQQAVGSPVSAEPLLKATSEALQVIK